MRTTQIIALSLLVSACGQSGSIPDQLEPFEAVPADDTYDALDIAGVMGVSGAEADYAVNVVSDASALSFSVHSPGHSDLMDMNGRTANVSLSWAGLHGERSIYIDDDAGPLYLVDVGWGMDQIDSAFGKGFASYGETVATDRDDQYDWTYTDVVFQTDDGPVSMLPGEIESIRVNGATFRAVVIAAYQVEARPMAALPCGGISDMLSYELIRVEAAPEPSFILRPDGAEFAYLGCL